MYGAINRRLTPLTAVKREKNHVREGRPSLESEPFEGKWNTSSHTEHAQPTTTVPHGKLNQQTLNNNVKIATPNFDS